jgi:hypothetical protein
MTFQEWLSGQIEVHNKAGCPLDSQAIQLADRAWAARQKKDAWIARACIGNGATCEVIAKRIEAE